mgnify:CR=1 FL=1
MHLILHHPAVNLNVSTSGNLPPQLSDAGCDRRIRLRGDVVLGLTGNHARAAARTFVEVDDHQRQLVVLPFAQAQGLAELRLEGQPVGQVGQRVVIGQVGQAVGGFGIGIRLRKIGDVILDLAVGAADGGNLQPAREGRTVLALIVNFALPEIPGLQGFPDGWTDIPGASDSARYKALGNSVAIPCVEFIMSRIAAALL